ncbi:carbohydrate ABC transporter substrate-binding protein [Paenibacillus sp. PR3]|uniref:Carbohydrate ABC transporter substrate-binding protein n=1 Tax=Paenibacillus terricola TaxID=2763503 RepID=A0ABR8N099_9BACL|nr:ABC transporter substrate-binding protein [Paenibacillus terricola]MBD3921611.1 carbohydrate ABC transporter substrate-binding protein [Paenibacillus terricola]
MRRKGLALSSGGQLQGRHGAYRLLVLMLIAMLVMVGCSDEQEPVKQPDELKVADWDENNFNILYGDYLNSFYPNTSIQFISTGTASDYQVSTEEQTRRWKQLLEQEQPDLVVIRDNSTYRFLADAGLLTDLSPYMQSSGITDEQIHPGVLELMKQNRDGLPYGMATGFLASMLYYNADLFQEYGIDLPHDGMTWEEVLHLANRFTSASESKDGPIGYYEPYSGPVELANRIGGTEGLSMYRIGTRRMTIDTSAWKQVLHTILSYYKDGTFRSIVPKGKVNADGMEYYDQAATASADLFGQGKAAMTTNSYGAFDASKVSFKLGAVNAPVDSATRLRSNGFNANVKLAVRAGSPKAQAAWNFIQFMTSDYVAKISIQQMTNFGLPVRLSYAQVTKDDSAADLYKQMPAITPPDDYMAVDLSFYDNLNSMLKREIGDVLADNQTEETMLKRMQKQGQQLLDTAKARGKEQKK